MIQNGIAHGGFAAFRTPAREEIADFVEPPIHYSTYQIFIKKGAEFSYKTTKDLYGKTIGKNRGFHISEEFSTAEAAKKIQIVEVSKMEQNIDMLMMGRLDAFIGNKLEVAYALKQLNLSDMIAPLPVPVRTPQSAYLMISKTAKIDNRRELINQLSNTLHQMMSDGTLNNIYEKYGK
jgi:polar amino acid transport system substrate-binding protein